MKIRFRYLAVVLVVAAAFVLANYNEWLRAGRPLPADRSANSVQPSSVASRVSPDRASPEDVAAGLREEAVPLSWLVFNRSRVAPGTMDQLESYPEELLAANGRMVEVVGMAALRWNPEIGLVDGLLRPSRLEGCCGLVCEHPLLQTIYVACRAEQPWPVASPIPLATVTGRLRLEPSQSSGYFYSLREAVAAPLELPSLDGP